jgi:group II intron reverse transcriptase/maturase
MDVDFLREAYRRTRKDSAPGVDGVRAQQYAENLDENLRGLHERLRSGRYYAPPVKRVWLEKDDGKRRPIGMAAFEAKTPRARRCPWGRCEQDFQNFSYGCRERRSAHQALTEVREQSRKLGINWIVDADITGFFDNLDHGWIREMVKRRINDGGILRLVGKWLNAGVAEGGSLSYPEKGTPQGGVISPLLANIYLHNVLDLWYVGVVKPRLRGRSFLVRFVDDFVIGCELEEDAQRVMAALPKRFESFDDHSRRRRRWYGSGTGLEERGGNGTFDSSDLPTTGHDAPGILGHQAADIEAGPTDDEANLAMVPGNRHPAQGATPDTCPEIARHYQYFGIRSNHKMLEVVLGVQRRPGDSG